MKIRPPIHNPVGKKKLVVRSKKNLVRIKNDSIVRIKNDSIVLKRLRMTCFGQILITTGFLQYYVRWNYSYYTGQNSCGISSLPQRPQDAS